MFQHNHLRFEIITSSTITILYLRCIFPQEEFAPSWSGYNEAQLTELPPWTDEEADGSNGYYHYSQCSEFDIKIIKIKTGVYTSVY